MPEYTKMKVERIDHNSEPPDLMVVNAARVSFGKRKQTLDESDDRLIQYLAKNNHWTPFGHSRFRFVIGRLEKIDRDVWSQLAHWALSPNGSGFCISELPTKCDGAIQSFCVLEGSLWGWLRNTSSISNLPNFLSIMRTINLMAPVSFDALACDAAIKNTVKEYNRSGITAAYNIPVDQVTLRISAPIFVLRQLMRSNHGIVYNEVSRRYVDDTPTFFGPEAWRTRPEKSIKQGSGDNLQEQYGCSILYNNSIAGVPIRASNVCGQIVGEGVSWAGGALPSYERLLELQVAPEQARMVLPLSTMSEVYATFTREAFNRVIALRSHGHAQKEIRDLAEMMKKADGEHQSGR